VSDPDTWLEDATEELGVNESDDVLRQIRDLLAMQVSGRGAEGAQEWLDSTLGSEVGLLGTDPTEGEEGAQTSPYFSADVLAERDVDSPAVINFGSLAETVVIHNVSTTVEIWFRDPGNEYSAITVEPGDSPFTFSGVHGAHTQKIWYKIPDGSGTASDTFSVLAKFYPEGTR